MAVIEGEHVTLSEGFFVQCCAVFCVQF